VDMREEDVQVAHCAEIDFIEAYEVLECFGIDLAVGEE